MKRILFETDWLASQPVFYNEKTGQASHNIHEVIDYADVEVHPEGFNNYLDFGYSILEQTPVKHVKFLRHSSRLWVDDHGKLSVEYLDDPVKQWLDYSLSEHQVIDLIRGRVQKWERSVKGEIIIPTSGGYDSRLLNWCIEDKSRIRSFTYGLSKYQSDSYEVVYARHLSHILGTQWEQIPLGEYHKYFEDWEKLFGVSTHAHGMYHIEFYKKILTRVEGNNPLLSGIIGDAWAGSVNIPPLEKCIDVKYLGYSHGLKADSTQSLLPIKGSLLSAYWENQKNKLEDFRFRVIEAMRFKIILLSYLRIVPQILGFQWWSPFLDIDIALAMLNLPQERRHDRLWQEEFFRRVGLDLGSMNLQASHQNTLALQAQRKRPAKHLDLHLLQKVVKSGYVEWINQSIVNCDLTLKDKFINKLFCVNKLKGPLKRCGFRLKANKQLEAYNAYLVLLPIENLLKRCIHQ